MPGLASRSSVRMDQCAHRGVAPALSFQVRIRVDCLVSLHSLWKGWRPVISDKMISKPLLFHKPIVYGGDEQILLGGSSPEVSQYICALTIWGREEFPQGLSGLMPQNRQDLGRLI